MQHGSSTTNHHHDHSLVESTPRPPPIQTSSVDTIRHDTVSTPSSDAPSASEAAAAQQKSSALSRLFGKISAASSKDAPTSTAAAAASKTSSTSTALSVDSSASPSLSSPGLQQPTQTHAQRLPANSVSSASSTSFANNGPSTYPTSPMPSSVDALGGSTKPVNPSPLASPPATASSSSSPRPPARRRHGSLSDRGAAVLRALARAPEDGEGVPTPPDEDDLDGISTGGAATPIPGAQGIERNRSISGTDDGYVPEANADVSKPSSPTLTASAGGLSEEAKLSGRLNREGLRKRGEQRQVEKLLGGRKLSNDKKKKSKKSSGKSWEIPRKIFHSSIGFLVLYLYLSFHDLHAVVRGLSTFLAIVITADVIRLNYDPFEKFYESVLGILMREAEKEKVNGVVWYLVGVIFALHFFPADIACVSVMILSWADTCASTFGRLFGKYTPALPSPPFAARKSLSGFLAAWIAGGLVAYLFWGTSIAERGERHFDGVSWRTTIGHRAVFGAETLHGWAGSGWTGWEWGIRGKMPPASSAGDISASAVLGSAAAALKEGHGNTAWSIVRSAAGKVFNPSGVDTAKRAAWNSYGSVQSKAAQAAQLAAKAKGGPSNPFTKISPPSMPLWLLCLGSGLVAAVAEGLELGGIDDNLSLPILSSTGIWAWLWVWGRVAGWYYS